ncbi:hypothetical protein D3C79_724590 [compost metagenome]
MQPHVQHLQHVGRSHGIPGIEHIVVAEADVDARLQHLLHPGDTAAFGVGIEPPLQVDVHQWVGHEVDVGHPQQAEQAGGVGPVVGVHGGGMTGGDPGAHAALIGQGGQGLDEAGLLIVYLVAMHIDQHLVLVGQLENVMQALDPVLPGELEVRDGPNHIGSQPERLFQQRLAVGIGEDPLLRESDYLQLDPGLHLLAHLQHGLQGDQVGVGHIHVGTDELDSVGDLPFQRLDGAPFHILVGQQRLALGPALYPLEQGAGQVPARLTRGLGGIEVNMGLDKGRDGEALLAIQHRLGGE